MDRTTIAILFLSAVFVASVVSENRKHDEKWQNFKKRHGRNFTSAEQEARRRARFEARQDEMDKHNEEAAAGKHTWTMGENEFMDLSDEDREKLKGARKPNDTHPWGHTTASPHRMLPTPTEEELRQLPASIDWRLYGYVNAIENQYQCGDCYIFSATGGLEGQIKRVTGTLVNLSEQKLLNCLSTGCDGGWMSDVNAFIVGRGGYFDTNYQQYVAGQNGGCAWSPNWSGAKVTGTYFIAQNEGALKAVVAQYGPVPVALWASDKFVAYRGGIFYDSSCPSNNINHAVLVVGYGTDSVTGLPYWIIKNSWGTTSWGTNGYMYLRRLGDSSPGNCLVAAFGQLPVVTR